MTLEERHISVWRLVQPVLYLLRDAFLELSSGSGQDAASLYGRVLVVDAGRQR
jgi:hypothetical protein